MTKLNISATLTLPLNAVTETFAIMAMRGVGKTHTASVMAEEMLKAGQPVVIYDPTGAWWGLKTSADGKRAGFQVVIFGGEHADVPLEPNAGEIVARAIVENRISAILDCSLLRKAHRVQFMQGFCEELYRLNREPLHLFLDEAHTVAPQNLRAMPEAARLLGALEDIVTQGRRRGLGMTVITQRPALLNSTLRNLCSTLIVMRVQGPHDRKAIQEWIEEAQANQEESKLVLPSLAIMPRGEGWVWSPAWLGILQRVKFRQRETFDSSATPEVGKQAIKPQAFAEVDIEALGEKIKATVERAKADDPAALKKRIAELEANKPKAETRVERIDREKLIESQQDEIRAIMKIDLLPRLDIMIEAMIASLKVFQKDLKGFKYEGMSKEGAAKLFDAITLASPMQQPAPVKRETAALITGEDIKMGKAERAIFTALAQHGELTKVQLSFWSTYSHSSSTFANAIGRLRTLGLMEQGSPLRLTERGKSEATGTPARATGSEMLHAFYSRLEKAERIMLEAIVEYGELTRESLSEVSGYSVTSSTFANSVGSLRSLEVLTSGWPIRLTPDFAKVVWQLRDDWRSRGEASDDQAQ